MKPENKALIGRDREVYTITSIDLDHLLDRAREEGPRAPAVARQDIIDAIHFAYASEGHIDVIADVAADRIMAMIPPVLPAVAGEVEGAVALIKAVRRMISEERKHAARAERGEDTTRDATDLAHADLMYFTVKDCDRAIAALQRPAVEGEKPVAGLRQAAIDAIALLDVAIAGTVFTKPDAGRVIVNVARAQKVLDALKAAVSAPPASVEAKEVDIRSVVWSAMERARAAGESREMAARWVAEDIRAAMLAAAPPSPEGARAEGIVAAARTIIDTHYDEDGIIDLTSANAIVGRDSRDQLQLKGSFIAHLERLRAALTGEGE